MKRRLKFGISMALAGVLAVAAGAADAQDKQVVMAVPSFLTGAASAAFGVPSRNGAEVMIHAINAGQLPPPYDSKGMAGAEIVPIFYDESGGNTKQVTEYRNKVQKENVDLFVGFVSSGTCQALTPIAEELKTLTIFSVCGTPRVFEELDPNPKYVFRTMSHATADNVAAAHYVKDTFGSLGGYTAINQNYAWGQDSWRDFDLSMKVLLPSAASSDKLQWPKLFAGQYGAEISALLLANEELVHSSLWGGDLEAFIFQASARDFFGKKKVLLTVGGTAAYRLGKKMPEGMILGSRGPYGIYASKHDSALNKWFQQAYFDRYNTPPTGPSYQYAQAVLFAKIGYDKAAAAKGGAFPTTEEVIAALEGIEFESISTTVKMALANGHQAITENVYGLTKWDAENSVPIVVEVKRYPAECVMPPEGIDSVAWIESGMKGAKCN